MNSLKKEKGTRLFTQSSSYFNMNEFEFKIVAETNNREGELFKSNAIDERNSSSPLNGEINDDNICNHFIKLSPKNSAPSDGPVYFFDLDNTIYPKSSGIDQLMVHRIELYFVTFLNLPLAESRLLGARFYRDYGLAIKGLIKHFSIDPVEYDRFVDGGLPLDDILKPRKGLTDLMDRLSRQGSCWVFTNAGKAHATRVLDLLQITSYFSGIIYCDYSEPNFPAKPDRLAFARAMQCAQIADPAKCFFFDDSAGNIRTAQEIGWNVVYVDEEAELEIKRQSQDEINASLEIMISDPCTSDNKSDNTKKSHVDYPTVNLIEHVEQVLFNKQELS